MRRFFVEEIRPENGFCSITGPEARHILKVLRMGPGDQLILMDGKGNRFLASIESAAARDVRAALIKSLPKPSPSPVEIILCQALLKQRQMDYVIQKTSELGVDCIIPFSSERTVVILNKDRRDNKMRHWREIAQSSAKQSDRGIPSEIKPLCSFIELMNRWRREDALKLILWEEEGASDLKSFLRGSQPVNRLVGAVGPEGGFSKAEIEAAHDAGFISVSLGRRTLRAETAAIALVAIFQYEWGDLSLRPEISYRRRLGVNS